MAVIWQDVRSVAEMFATGLARAVGWLFQHFRSTLERIGWLEQHYPAAPSSVIRESYGLMRDSARAGRQLTAGREPALPELPIGPAGGQQAFTFDVLMPFDDSVTGRQRWYRIQITANSSQTMAEIAEAANEAFQRGEAPEGSPRPWQQGTVPPIPGPPIVLAAYTFRR